jgi:hypothetical protein
LALAEIVATRIDFFLAGRWGALCGFRPERRPENKMVLLLHTKGAHHQNICGNGETEPATKNKKTRQSDLDSCVAELRACQR